MSLYRRLHETDPGLNPVHSVSGPSEPRLFPTRDRGDASSAAPSITDLAPLAHVLPDTHEAPETRVDSAEIDESVPALLGLRIFARAVVQSLSEQKAKKHERDEVLRRETAESVFYGSLPDRTRTPTTRKQRKQAWKDSNRRRKLEKRGANHIAMQGVYGRYDDQGRRLVEENELGQPVNKHGEAMVDGNGNAINKGAWVYLEGDLANPRALKQRTKNGEYSGSRRKAERRLSRHFRFNKWRARETAHKITRHTGEQNLDRLQPEHYNPDEQAPEKGIYGAGIGHRSKPSSDQDPISHRIGKRPASKAEKSQKRADKHRNRLEELRSFRPAAERNKQLRKEEAERKRRDGELKRQKAAKFIADKYRGGINRIEEHGRKKQAEAVSKLPPPPTGGLDPRYRP